MPIVTFTTDFGLSDHYVAAMKAAVLRHCPKARLVDVTHLVPPQDILGGSFVLERAVDSFEAGTIHVAVVDPGVGTRRRLLAVRIKSQTILCPDNGLISCTWRRHGAGKTFEITYRPKQTSATFHGRDILAPVAGRLAGGGKLSTFARPAKEPILLPIAPAASLKDAMIIHVDHYGNAITNVPANSVRANASIRNFGAVRETYATVRPGQPLALINSSGLLELAVRDGSAAKKFGLKVGDKVFIQ